jgi:hypothetical protein
MYGKSPHLPASSDDALIDSRAGKTCRPALQGVKVNANVTGTALLMAGRPASQALDGLDELPARPVKLPHHQGVTLAHELKRGLELGSVALRLIMGPFIPVPI